MTLHLGFLILFALAFAAGCSSAEKTQKHETYSGLGGESLSPDVIKKFTAPSLSPERSRKIQNMLDIRSPGVGLLHPNKKELFFSWKVTGVNQIWKLYGPQGFPVQMTGGEDSTSIVGIDPKGKFLVLSRDRAGSENPGLYMQNTEGGPLEVLQHKDKVQTIFEFISDDGQFLYYRANDISPDSYAIYRYDLKNKKSELLFSEKGYWDIVDHKPDGRLLLEKDITNVASEVYEWDPVSKALKPILGQGEMEEYSAVYGAEEGEYLVLTNKMSEFRRLYSYKNKTFTSLSDENLKSDVSEFQVDHPKSHLLYTINDGGYSKLMAYNLRTHRSIKLPPFPGADHVVPGTSTLDGEMVMLSVSTAKSPRVSYTYNWKTGKLVQWVLPSAPEIDLQHFAVAQTETYTNREGLKIPMLVRRPPQCLTSEKPCPVVVHFHGGPESQVKPGFSLTAQLFVDEGFIFVEPNVRGSDGYGKTWIHMDDGAKRLQVITDIPDAADWIKKNWKKGHASPKVGIMGWSYGGYSTQLAMTKFAGSFDAGVALVGMSNLKTFLKNTAPYRRALRVAEYGDPEKDSAALDQLSAMSYLDQVKAPMLLVQGVSDPRVPVGEAVQMYNAMKAKGLDAQLILFPDEGHGSQKRSNQVLELGNTLEFFIRHLR